VEWRPAGLVLCVEIGAFRKEEPSEVHVTVRYAEVERKLAQSIGRVQNAWSLGRDQLCRNCPFVLLQSIEQLRAEDCLLLGVLRGVFWVVVLPECFEEGQEVVIRELGRTHQVHLLLVLGLRPAPVLQRLLFRPRACNLVIGAAEDYSEWGAAVAARDDLEQTEGDRLESEVAIFEVLHNGPPAAFGRLRPNGGHAN